MVQGPKHFQQIGLLVVLVVTSDLVVAPVAAQGADGKAVMRWRLNLPMRRSGSSRPGSPSSESTR